MAEQVFRSPGFFEREIDLSQREKEIVGVPAGVIGTAEMGPAFVPVTLGSFADFKARFGELDPKKFGPYAVNEFLKNRTAITYIRVLGAGSNETTSDFSNTTQAGIVKNAGFIVKGSQNHIRGGKDGCVQFIVAEHFVSSTADYGYPIFTDNDSYGISSGDDRVYLVRAMLFTATGSRFQLFDGGDNANGNAYPPVSVTEYRNFLSGTVGTNKDKPMYKRFKLVLSTSCPASATTYKFNDEGKVGIRIYTASLDPSDDFYISKILNTDPEQFQRENHLLYGDFAVEDEVATTLTYKTGSVILASGSALGLSLIHI